MISASVDEADSIFIDEARTPLIISGPAVVHSDHNFDQVKPAIQSLVQRQQKLCDQFLNRAEEVVKELQPEDGSNPQNPEALEEEMGLLLYKAKLGQPRSDRLMSLLEDPENINRMNRAEAMLYTDQTQKMLYAQKEELFFASFRSHAAP